MAFVVALSVATLPVTGSASIPVKGADSVPTTQAMSDTEMSASMDGCCPDQAAPCDLPSDQCPSMASCVLQGVSLADASRAGLIFPRLAGNPLPILVEQTVPLHGGSPPFRPPRV